MSQILPFNDAWFVVTFYGESPASSLIKGWNAVLDYIDDQLGNTKDADGSVYSPCCDLHDEDAWSSLGSTYNTDDYRHTYHKAEFDYCVGLAIVRITEPVTEVSPVTIS